MSDETTELWRMVRAVLAALPTKEKLLLGLLVVLFAAFTFCIVAVVITS